MAWALEMTPFPKNATCELCGEPAIVQLRHTAKKQDFLYCGTHKPDLQPGKHSQLSLRRYRLLSDNSRSRLLAAPRDSPEHQVFRDEMCELKILGADGECKYYLSIVTGIDHFALWSDEFLGNLRECVDMRTNGAARSFKVHAETVSCFVPLLKSDFIAAEPLFAGKLTKQDRAIVLLLRNPKWSDADVARKVPTTLKQLQRFATYQLLRSTRARQRPPNH